MNKLLLTAVLVGHAASQPSCTYQSVDYSSLTGSADYAVDSEFYQNYEFVFNVCKQLVWSDGDCVVGSGMCERLKTTLTATDVYGVFTTAGWGTDSTMEYLPNNNNAHYVGLTGQTCMFGGEMSSRIYHECDASASIPYTVMLHESYYDCQAYMMIKSQVACGGGGGGGDPGKSTGGSNKDTDVGMIVCILFFLGGGAYFAIGGFLNHKKEKVGYDRVPHKEFWFGLPGLIKDGFEFTKGFVQSKISGGGQGTYESLP